MSNLAFQAVKFRHLHARSQSKLGSILVHFHLYFNKDPTLPPTLIYSSNSEVKVHVSSPAAEKRADQEVIGLFSRALNWPPSQLSVLPGPTKRKKILRASDVDANGDEESTVADFRGRLMAVTRARSLEWKSVQLERTEEERESLLVKEVLAKQREQGWYPLLLDGELREGEK